MLDVNKTDVNQEVYEEIPYGVNTGILAGRSKHIDPQIKEFKKLMREVKMFHEQKKMFMNQICP